MRTPTPLLFSLLLAIATATLAAETPTPPLTDQQQARLNEATRLSKEVVRLYKAGELREAIPMAQKVAAIRREILGDAHPDYAVSLSNLGRLYHSMGEYAKVEPLFRQALQIRKKALGEQHPDYAVSLSNLGVLYKSMGEYAKAEPHYVQARDIWKKALGETHPDYAKSLDNLAELYRSMGKDAKAEPLLVQAHDVLKKALGETHPDYATNLNNLAALYESMGEYAKAEPLFVRTLDIKKKALGETHPDYATNLNNLAELYHSMGEYTKAEPLLVQASEILRNALSKAHPDYATSLNNLAGLYQSMGEYAKAEALYVQAVGIKTKALGEAHPDYATSLNNLAGLYQSMGDLAKAEPLCVQARDIMKEALGETHPNYATSLNNLASLYESMGEYAKAEPLYVQALGIKKKALGEAHPDYAGSLNNVAGLYRSMGEYAKAEALLVQARDIWKKALGETHPDYAQSLMNLAALYQSMGEYPQAEQLLSVALHTKLRFVDRILAGLSEAQAVSLVQEHATGRDPLLSVLRRLPEGDRPDAYPCVWQTRALVTRMLAERRRSMADSPAAAAVFEELRKVQQQLAQLTLAPSKLQQREARQKRLAELNDQKEQLETRLAGLSHEFRRTQQVRAAQVADLLRLLPKDTAVVDIIRTTVWSPPKGGRGKLESDKHYEAFVLRCAAGETSAKTPWVHLGPAKPIDEALAQWRAAITEGKTTKPSPEATLREWIWDPIEPHLAGCKKVIVIPDGDLNFLPWAALPGRRQGTCLLEDYALTTAESGLQLYDSLTAPPIAGGGLMLVGGVRYDAPPSPASDSAALLASVNSGQPDRTRGPALAAKLHWDLLPGTETEIGTIQRLWEAPSQATLLKAADAHESALRRAMPQSRYIHLATHGFFADEKFRSMFGHDVEGEQLFGGGDRLVTARRAAVTARNPLILSGVVLAGANLPPKTDSLGLPTGEDGILTAEEIAGLDLRNTELVVLSACDTGLGRVAGGEGVMGLARAFHLAGARNVVASLWKVDDKATAALMKLFYHKLWTEKKPPIEALREAQLYIYRHPDEMPALAQARGPDLARVLPVPKAKPQQPSATAHPRLWAAFVLSGPEH